MEGGNFGMSQSIDNRVVQMQFDNKGFESGAKQSILTLEKLKKGLDLDKATASLSNLEKTFAGFSLGHIESAIDGIGDKFSALGVLGVTAMQKISSAAIDAGAKMVKALTIDNVSVGFNKYEQLTNAVQAIHSALPELQLMLASVFIRLVQHFIIFLKQWPKVSLSMMITDLLS